MSIAKLVDLQQKKTDEFTNAQNVVDNPHHEAHEGHRYYVNYSVADLGAMTTPNDAITLTFKTPVSATWDHFIFTAKGPAGALVKLVEAPTGGAASATGTLPILNKNRNYALTRQSETGNGTTLGVVNYDATLATGGTTIWSDYIEGSTVGLSGTGASSQRDETILKENTVYQVSIYSTATESASLYIDWYEHENKVD